MNFDLGWNIVLQLCLDTPLNRNYPECDADDKYYLKSTRLKLKKNIEINYQNNTNETIIYTSYMRTNNINSKCNFSNTFPMDDLYSYYEPFHKFNNNYTNLICAYIFMNQYNHYT